MNYCRLVAAEAGLRRGIPRLTVDGRKIRAIREIQIVFQRVNKLVCTQRWYLGGTPLPNQLYRRELIQ